MTKRRPVRINVELPELTAAQADFLWNFLEDIASALWDAYEADILDLQDAFSREAQDDSTADEYEAHLEKLAAPCDPVSDPESDPVL